MLQIKIQPDELWDEGNELFIKTKEHTLNLEHSLISLSRWESKWHKAFLTNIPKTEEEELDYIRCMTVNKDVEPTAYILASKHFGKAINDYITDPMTATTFPKDEKKGGREIITSELIYFWMINYSIPSDYEKWHLNRLLTLINVCAIKARKPKKMSQQDLIARNRALNEQRLQQYNTTG